LLSKCEKCGAVYEGAEMFCPKDGSRLVQVQEEGDARESFPTVAPEEDAYLGKVIQGRYKVLERLGEGGMGVVYIAEHVEIEKKVALKVLRDDFSKRPEVVERFRQEARSASKIGHPHIVDVTDFGQLDDGGVYFVMEYLVGGGLDDLIRGVNIELERAVPIVDQIARALKAAHEMGIVHRDLKPENIFLIERDGNQDFVKVLDFGIAKISDRDADGQRLTKTGMIFGTPEYMSPEQAAGKALDHRVDVYALGCIMFEMFTGRVPYDGDSFMAVLTQHMFEPIPLIEEVNPETDVPQSVMAVVYKAMAKNVEDRYADMDALREDLERALADANYVVEHPGRETTIKFSTRGTKSRVSQQDKVRTLMDWAPQTGSMPERRSGPPWPAIAAVAVLLVGGGAVGAYLLSSGGEAASGAEPVVPLAAPAAAPVAAPAPAPAAIPVPTPAAAPAPETALGDVTGQSKIGVSVRTVPEGAVVTIEGMGQVCSSTPCEVPLSEGEPVEISARDGSRSATMVFTPSEQNRELELKLKASASGGSKRRPRPAASSADDGKSAGKGGSAGGGKGAGKGGKSGLKIPDLFKE